MTTISDAWSAIRARAEAQLSGLTLWWPFEDNVLPDDPAPFVYFDLDMARARVIEYGGGQARNRHRNEGELHAYVFVPRGYGMADALSRGETVAAAFRSYRVTDIKCAEASVHPLGEGAELVPPGLDSIAENYSAALVIVQLYFDQIG